MKLPSVKSSKFSAQKVKTGLHGVQFFLSFIGWAMTIAVLASKGPDDGRTRFYFVLCWLTLPALVYLAMVPRFARTQKFVNPYASAAIDALFAILWFSAFVAVATWNSAGEKAGEEEHKKDKDPPKGCAAFGFGSKTRCNVSKGTVAIGALIFVLFILTSAMSVKVAFQFRKNGSLPGVSSDFTAVNAQTQDAFSSNHDDDELSYESAPHPPAHSRQDDEYGLLHSAERPFGAAHQHNSSEGHEIAPPYNEDYDDHYYQEPLPSAEMRDNRPEDRRYGGNSGPSGHVQFPEADYEYRGAAPR